MLRFLYMIPFVGLALGAYFFLSLDISVVGMVSLLAIVYSSFCLLYVLSQIFYYGLRGMLEINVELHATLIPLLFTFLCSLFLLYTTSQIIIQDLK